jgi:cobalt-zinc-cadmium efflux system membrane fusion protein
MNTEGSRTVLIVNGDESTGRTIGKLLAERGYAPILALTATEALEVIGRRLPRLAVLAPSLPDNDGLKLAQEIRSNHAGLPLILTTTDLPSSKRDDLEKTALFCRVLVLPDDLSELASVVDAALGLTTPTKPAEPPRPAPTGSRRSWKTVETGPVPIPSDSLKPGPSSWAQENPVSLPIKWVRNAAVAVCSLALVTGLLVFAGAVPVPWKVAAATVSSNAKSDASLGVELAKELPHTLIVPEDVQRSLGIRNGQIEMIGTAQLPKQSRSLVLSGSTALDPTRLFRIRARFTPARVVEVAPVIDATASAAAGKTVHRELRPGDKVKKGDLLGVFYSSDVGNKKNDLIDALVQLRLDEEILQKAEKAFLSGALPEVFLLNAQRNVEADRNAERRAVNTLKTWDIPEEDIKAVYEEAKEIGKRKGKRDPEKDKQWPKVELRAPDDGTIVERNVAQHEMVVDNTVNLFQIAKVDRLLVLASAPEDDLPTLQALDASQRRWNVRTVGANPGKGIDGTIDEIGYLIDPNQHTAVIKGHIDNPGGLIRGGQFVSATVAIPPPPGVVEVPVEAVVEDGTQCVVFVQADAKKHEYTLRRVQLTHRFEKTVFVRSDEIAEKERLTREEEEQGMLPREPLRVGERVLLRGVLELKAELQEKEAQPKSSADEATARK